MLITTTWLLQYLDTPIAHDALMEAFPRIGLEIEESKKLEDGYQADLNVLANRPDELGIIGIAREVAAHFNIKLKLPENIKDQPDGPSPVSVEIRDPDLCPRYIARAFSNVKIGPSPKWLQDILTAIDQRPINNVVDITNFVMFEFGQPLHAFDLTKVGGKKIIVRKMEANETLELLGGKKIGTGPTPTPTLVICDAQKPIALAGIMGGKDSETRESSTEILLEAANFDAPAIRRTAKRIELSTESSYRFERGCDPNTMLEGAVRRASQLIADLAAGKPAGASVDVYAKRREERVFKLTSDRVSDYLGATIDAATIKSSLEKLDMKVDADLPTTLTVHVPTWRIDAVESVVLIEDVARLVGYDNLPMKPTMQSPTLGARSPLDRLRQELARYLSSCGYFECRSPSLDAPEQIEKLGADPKSLVRLKNPMSREASVMRTSLLPALVRVAERNSRRNATTTRFFEQDKIYYKRTNDAKEVGAIETPMLAAVAGGLLNEFDWSGRNPAVSFFDLKGALEDILEIAGVREAKFEPVARIGFVTGTAAAIVPVSDASTAIGFVGQIDGKIIDLGKMPFKLFGFEIDLPELLKTHAEVSAYQPLSRTPAVVRDLAIVVKQAENFAQVDRAIRESAGASLESLRIVDLYEGKQVPAGHKSLAFRLVFRDASRTLTADEVQLKVDQIVAMLKEKFSATLRA